MTQLRALVDNNCTVAFAIFISLWAVFFIKFWGRYCAKLTHRSIHSYCARHD